MQPPPKPSPAALDSTLHRTSMQFSLDPPPFASIFPSPSLEPMEFLVHMSPHSRDFSTSPGIVQPANPAVNSSLIDFGFVPALPNNSRRPGELSLYLLWIFNFVFAGDCHWSSTILEFIELKEREVLRHIKSDYENTKDNFREKRMISPC
jgi:hypothetical protein